MEREYVKENNKSRERLKKLVNDITDEELNLVIYKEGWTIAAILAHIAFWDNYTVALLKRWKKEGISESHHEWDCVNDALVPLALNLPPRAVLELVISSANAADREAEQSTPEFVEAVASLNEPYRLNRSIHRKMHLDEIEALLKNKRRTG